MNDYVFDAEEILLHVSRECAASEGRLKLLLSDFLLLKNKSVSQRRRVEIFFEGGNSEIPEETRRFLDDDTRAAFSAFSTAA